MVHPTESSDLHGFDAFLLQKHQRETANVYMYMYIKKKYNVVSPNGDMDCGSNNVIYLIQCRKCGIQYVGKTSQKLRCRVNNHRNRIKRLCDDYVYDHFTSDGHTLHDVSIMPIEEVSINPNDKISIPAKLLDREEYWYTEICSIYPYGLNDNVRRVGNVSIMIGNGLNIYSMFNKQYHKSRRRISKRRKGKGNVDIN